MPVETLIILFLNRKGSIRVSSTSGESPPHSFNNIADNILCPQHAVDGAVFRYRHIIEGAGIRADMSAYIRITGSQPAVRCQLKGRRVPAAGDARGRQIFEGHLVHKNLINRKDRLVGKTN